ncbi:MAG: hypothetical protein PHY47_08505 [Lachnospiraceae bacterium]|nr:hypothetical protein [Lachnospiraceae bacterium]
MEIPKKNSYVNAIVMITAIILLGSAVYVCGANIYVQYGAESLGVTAGVFAALIMTLMILSLVVNLWILKSNDKNKKTFAYLAEGFVILLLLILGVKLRILTMQPVPFQGSTDYIKSVGVLKQLSENPSNYGFLKIASLILALFGYKYSVLIRANLVVQMIASLFAYQVSRNLFGKVSGVLSFAILMIIPSQIHLSFFLFWDFYYLCILFLTVLIYAKLCELQERGKGLIIKGLLFIFVSIFSAYIVFLKPYSIFLVLGFLIYPFIAQKREKSQWISNLLKSCTYIIVTMGVFGLLLYGKSKDLGVSYQELCNTYEEDFLLNDYFVEANVTPATLLQESLRRFESVFATDSYMDSYYKSFRPLDNQMIYLNICFMALISLIFLLFERKREIFPLILYFVGVSIALIIKNGTDMEHVVLLPIMAVLCGNILKQMVQRFPKNKKEETNFEGIGTEVIEKKDNDDDKIMNPEIAEYLESMKSDFEQKESLDMIELKESSKSKELNLNQKKEIHYIENPLPVPKRHTKKELEYDIEVSEEDDYDVHFDV